MSLNPLARVRINKDVPLKAATGRTRKRLIALAEAHRDDPNRPCCDADTTLADWIDAGFYIVSRVGADAVRHFWDPMLAAPAKGTAGLDSLSPYLWRFEVKVDGIRAVVSMDLRRARARQTRGRIS